MDLNLLRVLVALDDTRNVTRAAELLGMSQSGFSTALLRLRRQFDDELFIRRAGAMEPTARAERMLLPAREVLARVAHDILKSPEFDPATTATEFRLAMADVAEATYLPGLMKRLTEVAPNATVMTELPGKDELSGRMAAGSIDLAIGYYPDLGSQQFFRQKLYMHTYACIARVGHPLGSKLTVRSYASCGHAVAATPARSAILLDDQLARHGIRRRIVHRTPHHLVLPLVVAQTDLIATVPLAVASELSPNSGLLVLPLPFAPPRFAVQQHWHRSVHKDPRCQWLRAQVYALFAGRSGHWASLERSLYQRSS